jgi:hypothetical protein
MSDISTPTTSPDEPRDAHLRAALRHAPDAELLPPPHISAQILAAAQRAVSTPTATTAATRARPPPWRWLWFLPSNPGAQGALASVLLAGVIGLLWRQGAPGPETERADPLADAPVTAITPAAPAAPAAAASTAESRLPASSLTAPVRSAPLPSTQQPRLVLPPATRPALPDLAAMPQQDSAARVAAAPRPAPQTSLPGLDSPGPQAPAAPPAPMAPMAPIAPPIAPTAPPAAKAAPAGAAAAASALRGSLFAQGQQRSAARADRAEAAPAEPPPRWRIDGAERGQAAASWWQTVQRIDRERGQASSQQSLPGARVVDVWRPGGVDAGRLWINPDGLLWCRADGACRSSALGSAESAPLLQALDAAR